jgi:hypothetical protein
MPSISPCQKVILGVLDHAKSLQKHYVECLCHVQSSSVTLCSSNSESNMSNMSDSTSTSSSSSISTGGSSRSTATSLLSTDAATDLNEVWTTAQQWDMRSMQQVCSFLIMHLSSCILFPHKVEKATQLGLILIFYKEEDAFHFHCNLSFIGDNLIFYSASNAKQLPIPYQLAITLYCFGHFSSCTMGRV